MIHAKEHLTQAEHAVYAQWKRAGPHLREYASEFVGTALLVFCIVCFVAVFMSASTPMLRWLPSPSLRLFVVGLMLGGVCWLIAVSPPGRLSGAHVNPAVSVGFWLLGKMHGRDIAGYITGQMLGAAVGAFAGRVVTGAWGREIHEAVLQPTVSRAETFLLETLTTFALTLAIYACVSSKRLMRWTPAVGMAMTGLLVCLDGNISGAGMNPARWFGPALAVHFWHNSAVYILGPLLGASLAALLRRLLPFRHPMPHTCKLFHDPRYRSLFLCDLAPSTPPESAISSS